MHGIDAWHSVDRGRDELARIADVTGSTSSRHPDALAAARTTGTGRALEAGRLSLRFDRRLQRDRRVSRTARARSFGRSARRRCSSSRCTSRMARCSIRSRLDLSEPEAWERCDRADRQLPAAGGVLTVLWHDRSHGPERFWGNFYVRLVDALKSSDAWFGTGGQVVQLVSAAARGPLHASGRRAQPAHSSVLAARSSRPLRVRVHRPAGAEPDPAHGRNRRAWDGVSPLELPRAVGEADMQIHRAATASSSAPLMKSVCLVLQRPYDSDPRVRRKAEALVAAGYSVDVLAFAPRPERRRYTLNGVNVLTLPLGKKRGSLLRYLFEYPAFFLWVFVRAT